QVGLPFYPAFRNGCPGSLSSDRIFRGKLPLRESFDRSFVGHSCKEILLVGWRRSIDINRWYRLRLLRCYLQQVAMLSDPGVAGNSAPRLSCILPAVPI